VVDEFIEEEPDVALTLPEVVKEPSKHIAVPENNNTGGN
jgi:hypothetical protein